ncbi:hypothetical protein CC85DRAFT_292105 [Cutaneotrichosporon oleaginosum]|uniref:Zn(2)-C6 fungal-type domain-containing protein n=1 Tax=Cutaneotrichosporon oleaginosum TaxID=879819 RepID=A0A0J0XN21_9TREE|nr:uncharacterized protein CC85DRAFT_292105 [Cutaneotrichosporon oleaginosum]KLT42468.1 hypothetical protein CC85DRAFT_292105 [Cutaneotrichosporon oleaginosum]TXT06987.1 hypothetical protein COLE_06318 [Cutaneotrichosporon oleaginosum]
MSSDEHDGPPAKMPRTRIARACENCRARRKKCQPPYPCQACRDAGLPDCLVRDKPRPMRRRRSQQATSAPIEGSMYPQRTRFLHSIDEELERLYAAQTGITVSLALEEAPTHPDCNLLTPLPELPEPLPPSAAKAMQTFCDHMLPFCSYMTAPRVLSLFERYLSAPHTLSPDQTALMYSCLALGYNRLRTFGDSRQARDVPDNERTDVPYFRHAIHVLDKWGSASFTSLHTLSGLWYYSTIACTSETCREIVSWMIAQAKDLGIHQDQGGSAYSPSDRADLMFVQVLYSH